MRHALRCSVVGLALALSGCGDGASTSNTAAPDAASNSAFAQANAKWKAGSTFQDCPDCQKMVVIPAGAFKVGSTEEERAREGVPATFGDHEGPVIDVSIAKPYAIATTEITRGQFATFVRETGRPVPTECAVYNPELDNWAGQAGKSFNWQNPGFEQKDDHPVVCVSYDDARDYAAWLAKKTGKPYRLPSEAEWEHAARAGTTTTRYWGDSVTPICGKAHIMTTAIFEAIGKAESWTGELLCSGDESWTVPVGSYDPNPFGVYDMLGSQWEWIADCATNDHSGMPTDGSARQDGDCTRRISKGGAFHSRVWLARPATRGAGQPGINRPVASGIRIVRDLD